METMEWNPGKLLEVSGSYWKACTLHAGVKLGIFTLIGDRSRTDQEIAEDLGGDLRGVTMLLNALSALGLLTKKENAYTNTETSKTFLKKDSPQYLGYMLMHHHHLVESWSKLDLGVLTGKPTRSRSGLNEAVVRESFLMGMFNMAMNLAPRIVPEIDLSGRKHLL
ncbi:MAG TPA: methyltransferase dimerization domain-containing protein, partial [Thermodesulfobacteriota bacterium]|nr:methyltransferase dimerization domain-containing protein [Thermodesulfobacteriota bacterium]